MTEPVQDPAWGVQMMADGWSDAITKARKHIEELERQIRCVRLYGMGFLLQHGAEKLELNPADVTIVLPADQPETELERRSHIAELEERIRKVREIRDLIECSNCEHPAKLHDAGTCARLRSFLGREHECGCTWGGGDLVAQLDAALDEEGEKTDA